MRSTSSTLYSFNTITAVSECTQMIRECDGNKLTPSLPRSIQICKHALCDTTNPNKTSERRVKINNAFRVWVPSIEQARARAFTHTNAVFTAHAIVINSDASICSLSSCHYARNTPELSRFNLQISRLSDATIQLFYPSGNRWNQWCVHSQSQRLVFYQSPITR